MPLEFWDEWEKLITHELKVVRKYLRVAEKLMLPYNESFLTRCNAYIASYNHKIHYLEATLRYVQKSREDDCVINQGH